MKIIKKFFLSFLALFIIANLLIACTVGQGTTTTAQKEPLRVEYTLWWGDYTILIADELGLFDKYGVNVEPVFYESYADSYSDLTAGIVDGGLYVIDEAILLNDKAPASIIAVYDDGGINYLIGDSDINKLADLRGKRIGVSIGTTAELIVSQALEQANLTMGDVTLVDLPVEEIPANLGKTIDAGYAWNPYAAEAISKGANLLYEKNGTQSLTPDVMVFNLLTLNRRPQDVRAFLKAWFEAVDFRNANPEKSIEIISQKTGLSIDEITKDSQIYTLQENIVMFSEEPAPNMVTLTTALDANSNFLLNLGNLRNQPNFNQLINSSYLFQ